MALHIKIGTRGSMLALWQAHMVADALHLAGATTEIITIDTKGDKILDKSLAKIGSKGLFTEEIEKQLLDGIIDIAVHSAKDMQSNLPEHLEIIAFTKREKANDVLVSLDKNLRLNSSQPIVIGTSSARRRAMLRFLHPNIILAEARGNLQTRIRKMEEGQYQGMILAYAGIHRMKYDHLISEVLPLDIFTPAVGQGSIAIEAISTLSLEKREVVIRALNDEATAVCLLAERSLLKTLEGGCSIPLFCLAILSEDSLRLQGGIIDPDGKMIIREELYGPVSRPHTLGVALAEQLLLKGADKILEKIKQKNA